MYEWNKPGNYPRQVPGYTRKLKLYPFDQLWVVTGLLSLAEGRAVEKVVVV